MEILVELFEVISRLKGENVTGRCFRYITSKSIDQVSIDYGKGKIKK